MPDKHASTWESRELPVLIAIAGVIDEDPGAELFVHEVATAAGVNHNTALRATAALLDGGYIRGKSMATYGNAEYNVNGITEKGRRASGLWPDAEALTDRLLAALDQRIADTTETDTRSRLQRLRDSLRDLPREVVVSLIGSLGSGVILGG